MIKLKKQRSKKLDPDSNIVQEVFAAALDWIDALEQLDQRNIELSDETTTRLLTETFFEGEENAKK